MIHIRIPKSLPIIYQDDSLVSGLVVMAVSIGDEEVKDGSVYQVQYSGHIQFGLHESKNSRN